MINQQNQQRGSAYSRIQVNQQPPTFKYTVPEFCDPEPITCVLQPGENQGCGLYIGNLEAAKNSQLLHQLGIKAVLTASIETSLQYQQELVPYHLTLPAHDKSDFDLIQHLDVALEFLHKHFRVCPILVHCFMGISRSASLVIAFLMQIKQINYEQGLFFLRSKRRQVQPNPGFVLQLLKFEKRLRNKPSSQISIKQPATVDSTSQNTNKTQNGFQLQNNQQFYLTNMVQVPYSMNTAQTIQVMEQNQGGDSNYSTQAGIHKAGMKSVPGLIY